MLTNVVQLEIYSEGKKVETKQIELYKWYDGEIEEIDSDDCRQSRRINMIKGIQVGENGQVEDSWVNNYDILGRLIKSERFDTNGSLIESKQIEYDSTGKISNIVVNK